MSTTPSATSHSLISTKLVPPRRNGAAVKRESLVQRLLHARRLRCITIQGGAGSGKTSLLMAWQQALASFSFEVAWLSLSPDDDEPARFLDYLSASLARVDPAISREAALLGGLGTDRDTIERAVIALVQGLSSFGREVVLVLDDFQHLTDPGILELALQFLLDNAPSNFHLVIATRRSVPLALAVPYAQGQLLELDEGDLRFSPEESAEFLRTQTGPIDPQEAARLHALSDGWPAGLQLLALHLRQPRGTAWPQAPVHGPGAFVEYFEREVLARLDPEATQDLIRLSACTRFSARLAGALLAGPGGASAAVRAARLIAQLQAENLFIAPVESADRESWFRLHPLLREVLLPRLHALNQDVLSQLHARAADWFEAEDLMDEAVRHRLDAGQAAIAADMVERSIEAFLLRGDYRSLGSIMRRLPPSLVQTRLNLRFVESQLLMRTRQLDAYSASLDALESDIPAGDELNHVQVKLGRAALCVQRDDTAAAGVLLSNLSPLPPEADAWTVGRMKNLQSLVHLNEGNHEEARRVQQEGPERLVRGELLQGSSSGLLAGRCFVGLSHALEGNIVMAERQYREVLREAEGDPDRTEPACLAMALLGEVLYERSEPEAAIQLLEPRLDLLERVSIPDTVVRTLLTLSRAHALLSHQLESFAYLERLEDHATTQGLDRFLAAALSEQAQEYTRRLDFPKADAALRRLAQLEARHAGAGGTLAQVGLAAASARMRRMLAGGQLEAAAAQLAAFEARSRELRHGRRLARLRMLMAVVERLRGNEDAARRVAQEALALGHRLGLARSLLDAHPDAAVLVRTLLQKEELPPVLAYYADRLLRMEHSSQLEVTPPPTKVGAPFEALSQRETEILQLLTLAMSVKKIARTLDLSVETVKWHLRNVYRKLKVNERDSAVARARDLGLTPGA